MEAVLLINFQGTKEMSEHSERLVPLPLVGVRTSFSRQITEADIELFAQVSSDHNPEELQSPRS